MSQTDELRKALELGRKAADWIEADSRNRSEEALKDLLKAFRFLVSHPPDPVACYSCESPVEDAEHHWFMDHGKTFLLCNDCWTRREANLTTPDPAEGTGLREQLEEMSRAAAKERAGRMRAEQGEARWKREYEHALTAPAPDGGLRDEVDKLREALRPFAIEADQRPWIEHSMSLNIGGSHLINRDLFMARAALRAQPPKETKG